MPKNAGMSLTTQDLQAIQRIVDASIEASEQRMRAYVDEAIDSLARQTAAGFQEVHERLDRIEERLDRVEYRLDQVELRLDRVEHRLDLVEQRLDRVEGRLDQVEQRLDRVEHRLESMEQTRIDERIRADVHDEQINHITTTLRAV